MVTEEWCEGGQREEHVVGGSGGGGGGGGAPLRDRGGQGGSKAVTSGDTGGKKVGDCHIVACGHCAATVGSLSHNDVAVPAKMHLCRWY